MPITVCHPVWRLERGGLERQLVQLVSRGDPAIRPVLIVRGGIDACDDLGQDLPPTVLIIREPGNGPDANWSRRLAWVLRRQRADILHIRGLSMLLDGVMAADLCESLHVTFSFHGFESQRPRWSGMRRCLLREAVLWCDDRAAVGAAAARALSQELDLPESLFAIVPNGVDANLFRPPSDRRAIRRALDLPADRFVVLCVANLKPVKGHATYLRAIASLKRMHDVTTFIMVGRDYSGGEIEAEARSRCPNADIRFTGPRDDVPAWYQAADLYIQPSLWEGHCNAILEAMSSGLAVIATHVGGNSDSIDHGRTGLLVAPGEEVALAAAMSSLSADAPRRTCLGQAARQRVLADRRLDVALQSWIDRYKNLAKRRTGMPSGRSCALTP